MAYFATKIFLQNYQLYSLNVIILKVILASDVTSNECIAGNGYTLERRVIKVSTKKNDVQVQYLYDIPSIWVKMKINVKNCMVQKKN